MAGLLTALVAPGGTRTHAGGTRTHAHGTGCALPTTGGPRELLQQPRTAPRLTPCRHPQLHQLPERRVRHPQHHRVQLRGGRPAPRVDQAPLQVRCACAPTPTARVRTCTPPLRLPATHTELPPPLPRPPCHEHTRPPLPLRPPSLRARARVHAAPCALSCTCMARLTNEEPGQNRKAKACACVHAPPHAAPWA